MSVSFHASMDPIMMKVFPVMSLLNTLEYLARSIGKLAGNNTGKGGNDRLNKLSNFMASRDQVILEGKRMNRAVTLVLMTLACHMCHIQKKQLVKHQSFL